MSLAGRSTCTERKSSPGLPSGQPRIGPYHNIAVYNGPRRTVILGGGNGSQDLYELDARGRITKLRPRYRPSGSVAPS